MHYNVLDTTPVSCRVYKLVFDNQRGGCHYLISFLVVYDHHVVELALSHLGQRVAIRAHVN